MVYEGEPMALIELVEDEEVLRRSLMRGLERQGHAVRAAETAEEGWKMVEQSPPDLVITDFRLPGMSGHDLLAKVKEAHPEVAVIVITAHGTSEDAEAARRIGAADYLSKPVDLNQLSLVIERCLDQRKLIRACCGAE
jgi:DNA-binding NtrC family response regulator